MNKKILLIGGAVALGALFLLGGKGASEQSMGGSFGGVDSPDYIDQLGGGGTSPTYVFNTEFPEQIQTDYLEKNSPILTDSSIMSSNTTLKISTTPTAISGIKAITDQYGNIRGYQDSIKQMSYTSQSTLGKSTTQKIQAQETTNYFTGVKTPIVASQSAYLINLANNAPKPIVNKTTGKISGYDTGKQSIAIKKTPVVTSNSISNKSSPSVTKKTATNYFLGK